MRERTFKIVVIIMVSLAFALALLTVVSGAWAQDMPDIVQVSVNLAFAIPTQSTPVTVTGTAMYQNTGPTPGYVSQNFVVSGEGTIQGRQRVGAYVMLPPPCCPTIVWLQAPWADAKNPGNTGYTTVEMTFEPSVDANGPKQKLAPGSYPISARYENVPGPPYIMGPDNFWVYATAGLQSVVDAAGGGGGGGGAVVATPELAIMRQLGLLGPRLGSKVAGIFNPTLQRITAWGAAKLLNAPSIGDRIYLPELTLEVIESCSGLDVMKWLAILAVICIVVGRTPWPWALAVIVAAPIIGYEVNVLRVVGIGLAYERYGWAIKDPMGWAALVLGVVEVIGVGAMARRRK